MPLDLKSQRYGAWKERHKPGMITSGFPALGRWGWECQRFKGTHGHKMNSKPPWDT